MSAEEPTMQIQITLDCADPHALAEWWSQTIGWPVEPTDADFIRTMVEAGHATQAETRVYKDQLVWATGAAISVPDAPDGAPCRRFLFQAVPEPRTVKNRMHLDLRLTPGTDLDTARDALLARGASFLHEASQGPVHRWYTMADPEGNEFCIS